MVFPRMGLTVSTAELDEPVSVTVMKNFLRVDISADDTEIAAMITAARQKAENYCNNTFITTVWDMDLDEFPSGSCLLIPRPPLQSITSITYYDTDDSQQTWSSANYQVDAKRRPGRVMPVSTATWPSTFDRLNAVTIKYVAGYGDSDTDVPPAIASAIKLMVDDMYNNREGQIIGGNVTENKTVKALLDRYKVPQVG